MLTNPRSQDAYIQMEGRGRKDGADVNKEKNKEINLLIEKYA